MFNFPSFYQAPAPRIPPSPAIVGVLRAKISFILTQNGGKESNIGFPHEYWFSLNLLRSYERAIAGL